MHATIRHQAKRAASLATTTALLAAGLSVLVGVVRPPIARADLITTSIQRASLSTTATQFSAYSWRAGISAGRTSPVASMRKVTAWIGSSGAV